MAVVDGVLDWGLQVIAWLQQASPRLDGLFAALSFLGDEAFLVLLIPLVYWAIDRDAGVGLLSVVLVSIAVNTLLKEALAQPRPADYADGVAILAAASGFGLPSGHAQMAVVVAGYGWYRWRRWYIGAVALIMAVGTPLSRVYLGVHFPTDVLGGALVGLLVLAGLRRWGPALGERLRQPEPWRQLMAVSLIAGIVVLFQPDADGWGFAAALAGLLGGVVLERRAVGYRVSGDLGSRLGRYLVGLAILALWFWGIGGWADAHIGGPPAAVVRYGPAAAWVTVGAPWVFAKWWSGKVPAV